MCVCVCACVCVCVFMCVCEREGGEEGSVRGGREDRGWREQSVNGLKKGY